MLEIKKEGFFLDLYPGSVISMEISNTALDDDIVNGSYSFPFKLPLTARNKQLLHFPDEIASVASIQVAEPVQVWVDGLLIFPAATLKIKNVNSRFINVYLLVGISTLAAYADATKVADKMDYPLVQFDTTSANADDVKLHAKNTLTATVDTMPYVFPTLVNNDQYQNQLQEVTNGFTKDVVYNLYINNNFELLDRVIVTDQSTEAGLKHARLTMVPFLYVTYIVRKILDVYHLTSNIFETDPELKKLILFNNFSLDKWYPIFEQYFLNRNNRSIDLKNHVPDQTVGQFIVALKKVFCLYFYKDPFNDKIYLDAFKNVINDNDYVDWSSIAVAENDLEENLGKGVKYLPDIQTDRILAATGSMLKVNRKPAVMTQGDLPASGNAVNDVRMVEGTGMLYSFQNVLGFGLWIPYTNAFGDYYQAPAEYELKNTMPAVVTSKVKFYPSRNFNFPDDYFVPVVGIPGSYESNDNKQTNSPIVSKLMFYRGMKTSAGGREYPFASSHNYDANFNKVGNYSLAWDGEDGLYNTWWKDYLRMKDKTKQVTRQVILNIPTLLNLDLRKKVRIGSSNFLIRKISLQLPLTKPATVELWKVD